ncbi:MAG: cob(I)yrinic acid a,c-diamide adenosyltransferase [Oscillospiraceae bacterium]|jgi:cob(I)alamin adenosyltransferase|nr:cob(I)yrinic acid a,c-diamide adenosyltransferase [Oscillospiraceae bacterium]
MAAGLIHLYTGDGKGKTTAALGLLLRAHGRGMRCVLAQFCKGRDTGELTALENLPGVTVLRLSRDLGFFRTAKGEDRAEMLRQHSGILTEAEKLIRTEPVGVLVLDEICAAYRTGALDRDAADRLIRGKPPYWELVLTGRDAPESFFEAADYVTEFVKRKHPFDRGVPAREGIEF